MKSTILQLQKNNFKIVGKKLIFTIGTALLAFANVNAENVTTNDNGLNPKVISYTVQDTAAAHPQSLVGDEGIEQVINQDSQITETTVEPAAPLLPGKSPEEIVADDNLVIEGAVTKEIYPLDFKKINGNKKPETNQIKNNDRLVGSL